MGKQAFSYNAVRNTNLEKDLFPAPSKFKYIYIYISTDPTISPYRYICMFMCMYTDVYYSILYQLKKKLGTIFSRILENKIWFICAMKDYIAIFLYFSFLKNSIEVKLKCNELNIKCKIGKVLTYVHIHETTTISGINISSISNSLFRPL